MSLEVIGNHALWADYRGSSGDLHALVAAYHGALSGSALPAIYRAVDALVQRSHYEPFALTVGKALASGGLPVVTCDEWARASSVASHQQRAFPGRKPRRLRGIGRPIDRSDSNMVSGCRRQSQHAPRSLACSA